MPKVTKTNQSSVNTEVEDQLQSHPTYEAYVQLQANYHHMVHVLKKARGNDVMVTPFPKFSDFRWMLRNGCYHFSVKQFIFKTGSAKVDAVYDYWFTIPQEVIDSYGNAQPNIDATESGNGES